MLGLKAMAARPFFLLQNKTQSGFPSNSLVDFPCLGSSIQSRIVSVQTRCDCRWPTKHSLSGAVMIGSATAPTSWKKILPPSFFAGTPILLGALIPVVLTVYLSKKLELGLENEICCAVFRASAQLCTLGFALKVVFEGQNVTLSIFAMIIMVVAAGQTSGERAKLVPQSQLISTVALVGGAFGTLWLMVLLKVFPLEPRYLIPSTGFLVGNSMTVVAIVLNGIQHDIHVHGQQIEAALALGATPYQAIRDHLRRSLIRALGPIFDYMKVSGLVTLPGAMTGMLMSGSHPLEAVRSSLILLYMLVGAASLTSVIGAELGWRTFFSKSYQLRRTP